MSNLVFLDEDGAGAAMVPSSTVNTSSWRLPECLMLSIRLIILPSDASYIARLKIKVGIGYEQRHMWSMLRDIADLNQNMSLDRSTILHNIALHYTDVSLREVLAKGGVNVNDVDGLGFTALHWSVIREDMSHVTTLLKAGANVNMPTTIQKWSALHLACMRSSCQISTTLIEAGAQLGLEDHKGRTPLHYISIEDADLVQLLLAHGADAKHEDYIGNGVLHNMARGQLPYVFRERRRQLGAMETMRSFEDRGVKMDVRNPRGETPTMLLAIRNASAMSEMFAHDYLSFKEPFPDSGWNIMHYAAYYWDSASLTHLFFEGEPYGSPPMFDPDALDHQGVTPLDALEYRMFVPDEKREAGIYKPTRKEVATFVALLNSCRYANWDGGHYLETKQRFLEDGSQEKMEAWLTAQNCQKTEHQLQLWQDTDTWWRNIERPVDCCA